MRFLPCLLVLATAALTVKANDDPCRPGADPYAVRLWSPVRADVSFRGGLPPVDMPIDLIPYYTRCGTIDIDSDRMYIDDSNHGAGTHYKYSRADIDALITSFRTRIAARNKLRGSASAAAIGSADRALKPNLQSTNWLLDALHAYPVTGLRVVVFGSTEPWLESLLLASGAAHVRTVEYNRLTYDHPQLSTQVIGGDNDDDGTRYDAAFSLSAFDHDGLGRYGDPLGPDRDLMAMDAVRTRWLKPNAAAATETRLYLTVPIGPDAIAWNLMRRYGAKRLPLLLGGWTTAARFGWDDARVGAKASIRKSYEPVFVLTPATAAGVATAPAASKPKRDEL